MKIIKVVNLNKKFKAKNGKEYSSINYYVQLDNKKMIAIRPSFAKGYYALDVVAETIINKGEKENEDTDTMPF